MGQEFDRDVIQLMFGKHLNAYTETPEGITVPTWTVFLKKYLPPALLDYHLNEEDLPLTVNPGDLYHDLLPQNQTTYALLTAKSGGQHYLTREYNFDILSHNGECNEQSLYYFKYWQAQDHQIMLEYPNKTTPQICNLATLSILSIRAQILNYG